MMKKIMFKQFAFALLCASIMLNAAANLQAAEGVGEQHLNHFSPATKKAFEDSSPPTLAAFKDVVYKNLEQGKHQKSGHFFKARFGSQVLEEGGILIICGQSTEGLTAHVLALLYERSAGSTKFLQKISDVQQKLQQAAQHAAEGQDMQDLLLVALTTIGIDSNNLNLHHSPGGRALRHSARKRVVHDTIAERMGAQENKFQSLKESHDKALQKIEDLEEASEDQARHNKELEDQLKRQTEAHVGALTQREQDFQKKLATLEENFETEKKSLQESHAAALEQHQKMVHELQENINKMNTDHADDAELLKAKLASATATASQMQIDHEEALESKQAKHDNEISILKSQYDEKEREFRVLQDTVASLRLHLAQFEKEKLAAEDSLKKRVGKTAAMLMERTPLVPQGQELETLREKVWKVLGPKEEFPDNLENFGQLVEDAYNESADHKTSTHDGREVFAQSFSDLFTSKNAMPNYLEDFHTSKYIEARFTDAMGVSVADLVQEILVTEPKHLAEMLEVEPTHAGVRKLERRLLEVRNCYNQIISAAEYDSENLEENTVTLLAHCAKFLVPEKVNPALLGLYIHHFLSDNDDVFDEGAVQMEYESDAETEDDAVLNSPSRRLDLAAASDDEA